MGQVNTQFKLRFFALDDRGHAKYYTSEKDFEAGVCAC
jgi:hypothetical protein